MKNYKEERNKQVSIKQLIRFADVADWDRTCVWAEENIPEIAKHMDIWGKHCGAPRSVYLGHIVRMIIDIYGNL